MDIKDIWTVEYSKSQNSFHTDTLISMTDENFRDFMAKKPLDWVTIGVFTSAEEAHKFANDLSDKLDDSEV